MGSRDSRGARERRSWRISMESGALGHPTILRRNAAYRSTLKQSFLSLPWPIYNMSFHCDRSIEKNLATSVCKEQHG